MHHIIFIFIFIVFIVSLLVSSLMYGPVVRYAKKHFIYDNPEAKKLQRRPIPVLGGLVVFLGAIAGLCSYWFVEDCSSILPVQIAMLVMLVVGGWDDIKKLSPTIRLVLETLTVVALMQVNGYSINDFHGLWGIHEISPWIAWPLTVLACVGIINAINLIDGIDGLSSGIGIMAFGFYGVLFFYSHDFVRVALAVAIVGALIPFFIMNVFGERSKMFIGDAGTLMLGIALSDLVMAMLTKDSMCAQHIQNTNFSLVAFALAVLVIPVFDTLRVMFGRIFRGESPFGADKTHLHHAFIEYGFHHLETALMEIMLSMMVIGLWWLFYKSHLSEDWQLYIVIAAGIAISCGLYYMLGRRKRIAKKVKERYGLSVEEFENLSDEERTQLRKQK